MKAATAVAVACAMTLMACGSGGPKGDPGPAGPGINETVNYSCHDTRTAVHEVYLFPDGSIMTNCELSWTLDGITSGFALWRVGQVGTKTAACIVSGGSSWAEFNWNGALSSTMTVHGSTDQAYTLTCTKY